MKYTTFNTMKRIKLFLSVAVLISIIGCKEEVDTSSRYVFKEETISSYLEKHSQYSEYYELMAHVPVSPMTKTNVRQLMSARGNYTCFAPTNDAIKAYLDSLVSQGVITEPTWSSFRDSVTLDSIRKVIVYNSIIDGGDEIYYETASFPYTQDAEIPHPNMYDRKLSIHYCANPDSILVNDCSINVRNRDIPAINGVIHAMDQVIAPSNNTLAYLLQSYIDENKEGYHVAALLARSVGLMDSLDRVRDEAYETLYQSGALPEQESNNGEVFYTPEHRYFGFTYFAETDEFWAKEIGKPALEITVNDVINYLVENNIYPDAVNDENYKNENNLLNQFVTYHFLPMRLATDRLVNNFN